MKNPKTPRLSIFIISLIFYGPTTWSATVETVMMQKLMQATHAAEVSTHLNDLNALKLSELACRMQIQQKGIPTECYRLLALEKIKSPQPKAHWQKLEQALDNLCIKNGQIELHKDSPTIPQPNPHLSQSCYQQLMQMKRYKEYQNQSGGWSDN